MQCFIVYNSSLYSILLSTGNQCNSIKERDIESWSRSFSWVTIRAAEFWTACKPDSLFRESIHQTIRIVQSRHYQCHDKDDTYVLWYVRPYSSNVCMVESARFFRYMTHADVAIALDQRWPPNPWLVNYNPPQCHRSFCSVHYINRVSILM